MKSSLTVLLLVVALSISRVMGEESMVQFPTSAQVTTDIAGQAASAVKEGVLRVICKTTSSGGTGFLHSSGTVVTAAHVVNGCKPEDLLLVTPAGQVFSVAAVDADNVVDLALVKPSTKLPGHALSIAPVAPPVIGMHVATWGYPGGYDGLLPLLSVGYLAGTQDFKDASGAVMRRWVVNAAFNGGNSGGPLLALENGSIVGVVSSKLAPMPTEIAQIIDLLSKQHSGFIYQGTKADGTKVTFTEGQLIGEALQYLRSQVQLVVGYTVSPEDIAAFLKARNIIP